MSDEVARIHVLHGLKHAQNGDGLTSAVKEQAAALHRRLEAGVTIALLGPKGSGKTAVLDLLLQEMLPPPSENAVARMVSREAVFEDLKVAAPGTVDWVPAASTLLTTARFIDVQGHTRPELHRERHLWALAVADMVLWCGPDFTKTDVTIWSNGTDALKDHSFLVLTQADRLAAAGTLKQQLLRMHTMAADEFQGVFPTTTAQFQQLVARKAPLTEDAFAASGAKALSDAVLKLARAGQQADLDRALLFLERHGVDAVSPPTEALKPPAQAEGITQALALIRQSARDMKREISDPDTDTVDTVLETCGALSESLADLADGAGSSPGSLDAWRDEFAEASDKIVLMGLEGDTRSAADALTILLQVSRDLEQRALP